MNGKYLLFGVALSYMAASAPAQDSAATHLGPTAVNDALTQSLRGALAPDEDTVASRVASVIDTEAQKLATRTAPDLADLRAAIARMTIPGGDPSYSSDQDPAFHDRYGRIAHRIVQKAGPKAILALVPSLARTAERLEEKKDAWVDTHATVRRGAWSASIDLRFSGRPLELNVRRSLADGRRLLVEYDGDLRVSYPLPHTYGGQISCDATAWYGSDATRGSGAGISCSLRR